MSTDFIFKTVIVGNTGVGKSCLLQRYTRDQFIAYHESTIGVDFATKELKIPLNNELHTIKFQLWDTAGQEKFRSITLSYYRNCCAAVVVCDLTNRESFDSIDYWIDNIKDGCGAFLELIIIGNKSDLDGRVVSEYELKEKADKYNIKYYVTSAKKFDATNIPFNILAQDVLEKVKKNPHTVFEGVKYIRQNQEMANLMIGQKRTKKIHKCCRN